MEVLILVLHSQKAPVPRHLPQAYLAQALTAAGIVLRDAHVM